MSLFIAIAAALAAASVLLLVRGMLRAQSAPAPQRNAAALREQMAQLKQLRASGTLSASQFDEARAKLEQQIVAAVLDDPVAPASGGLWQRVPKPLLLGIAGFVFVVTGGGYAWLGTPAAMDPAMRQAQAEGEQGSHTVTREQIAAMVDRLAERLKANPDDSQGWGMLARSYAVLGRHADSLPAFKRALELQPDEPVLLADYADAMAVVNKRSLEGEPIRLVERALQLDPGNLKALSLAGTAAFNRRDFSRAIDYWEKLVRAAPPDSPFVDQIRGGIEEARQLLAGGKAVPGPAATTGTAAKQDAKAQATAPRAAAAPGDAARVSGMVKLAPALAAKAAPGDTVFVFARALEGPRAPLAVLRKQVKDLPLQFTLDDSLAMSPTTRLSGFKQVVVSARISKSGDPVARAGDLQGQTGAVAVGSKDLTVEISEVVAR